MADVLNRDTLEHRRSVNTPDFSDPPWILDPDMSAVSGVPFHYWKIVGDAPVSMTAGEKDAVDAAVLQAERDSLALSHDGRGFSGASLRLLVREINILRVIEGLEPRTEQQVKNALRGEINGNG